MSERKTEGVHILFYTACVLGRSPSLTCRPGPPLFGFDYLIGFVSRAVLLDPGQAEILEVFKHLEEHRNNIGRGCLNASSFLM